MQKSLLQLDQSSWWIIVIILLAAGLTWFLYSIAKKPWNSLQGRILSFVRFAAIFLVLFLLLEPLIKQVISRIDKPVVAIVVDTSESIIARSFDSVIFKSKINSLTERLGEEDFEVKTFFFDETGQMNFSYQLTDLSLLLKKVDNEMEGRNWATTLLFTDGIFNQGSSPLYRQYAIPQFTIGLGDTIPPKDISISRVLFNQITYKGNETPIRVEISQKGFDTEEILLTLAEGQKVLQQKVVKLNQSIQEVEFTTKSEAEGLRRLSLSIPVEEGEYVNENNQYEIFIEVIDSKQKVLMVAGVPHPDIKAIRESLSSTGNYQTDVYIPSLGEEKPTDIYDVVIYHGTFSESMDYQPKESPGTWYILGNESSLNTANENVPFLHIQRRGSQPDHVTGVFNQSFSKFKIPDNKTLMENFPPIDVPFGEYSLGGSSEVLLFQRVGNIVTNKPLFVFFDDGSQKSAVFVGHNIWKWKLQEAAVNGTSVQFQQLISKTVQFLSVKNDKKQFQFRSRGNTFSNAEIIRFDAEVYNDIYERVYGNTISLKVTSQEGKIWDFEFVDSEFKSFFKVPPLESGLYSYEASVITSNKKITERGQFLVEKTNREYSTLAADHNLLKSIALKTGGEYLHYSQVDQIMDKIKARDFKNIVSSSESDFPLIQSQWMLLVILLLFSIEWFLRKYWGGY